MTRIRTLSTLLAVAGLCASAVCAAPLYTYDPSWPQWPGGAASRVSLITAVAVDSDAGEVHVAQRGNASDPVWVFSASTGVLLRTWGGGGAIGVIHGMRVQRAAHQQQPAYVWVTDIGDHTVKQFIAATGQLVTTLGTAGHAGTGVQPFQFSQVADVAFDADGTLYIADGDGGLNSRISAWSAPDYTALRWVFGHNGTSNNDFNSPHSLAVDQLQRVWVADRGNARVQIFGTAPRETEPLYLNTWSCFSPAVAWGVAVVQDRSWLAVADGNSSTVRVSDAQADRSLKRCNTLWSQPIDTGAGGQVHLLDADQFTGDLYVAVIGVAPNTFVRKFAYTGADAAIDGDGDE